MTSRGIKKCPFLRLGGVILVVASAGAPAPLAAVQVQVAPEGSHAVASRKDSTRTLRSARGEQARFERIRFGDLPWRWDSHGGECDERVGRFCLWYGDDEGPEWEPPSESDKVRSARDTLVARLGSAARLIPGDAWIAGQRVRYAVEAGNFGEARRAAEECRADDWWCAALAGYALHMAQSFEAADSMFATALLTMPAKERNDWLDLRPLLGDKNESVYRKTKGADRDSLVEWMWWLADPLWMLPGNDRRTEHFARLVADGLQDRAKSTDGISWGSDLRELLIRYGAPVGWERIRPKLHESGRPSVVTHYAPKSRFFLPPLALRADLTAIGPEDFQLDPRISRSVYAPPYAEAFDELSRHQVAIFRRGPLALIVAALEMQRDSVPDTARVRAALILGDRPGDTMRLVEEQVTGRIARLELFAPARPAIMSLEALASAEKRAARARYGIAPKPEPVAGLAMSDLLLTDADDPLPQSLEEAAPRARTSMEVRSGERIGVFWEVYAGDERGEPVVFEVALYRSERGLLRRFAEKVGLASDGHAVSLRWEGTWGDDPRLEHSVNVQLPELSPGTYTLEVAVRLSNQAMTSATREVRIVGR